MITLLFEKISVEEVIGETIDDNLIEAWAKYIASLCKNCGAEQGEQHCQQYLIEENYGN